MPSIAQIALFFVLSSTVLAAPAPVGDSYTGSGGSSLGGGVQPGLNHTGVPLLGTLLEINSGNGGDGGPANSGSAISGPHGNSSSEGLATQAENKYTGSGGSSTGGSVTSDGALIKLGSNNAGSGSDVSSGNAISGLPALIFHKSPPPHKRTSRVLRINLD